MALINCPKCGDKISDKAKYCPNCNTILKETKKYKLEKSYENNKKKSIIFVKIFFIIILILTVSYLSFILFKRFDPRRFDDELLINDVRRTKNGNFMYTNVDFKQQLKYVKIIGKITNVGGENYQGVSFDLKFFNRHGKEIAVEKLILSNFSHNTTKSFSILVLLNKRDIEDYVIEYNSDVLK